MEATRHSASFQSSSRQTTAQERNLDHLDYDENLYDFMKSLIPFNLVTANKSLNKHLLEENGLEKGQFLNIYFNDVVGKRELTYELILSAILPKEWSLEDSSAQDAQPNQTQAASAMPSESQTNATGAHEDSKQIPEGQELHCVLLDIQGQFSARKFVEKVRHVYEKHQLHTILGPRATEKQINENKTNFIKMVLSNLFVFPCMDAIEFNLVARSLCQFLRKNKSVGLLVIDGIHFIESAEILAAFEKKQVKQKVSGRYNVATSVDALAAGPTVEGDDFFSSSGPAQKQAQVTQITNSGSGGQAKQQNFFIQKVNPKAKSNRNDPKVFDQSLVDSALAVINELQKVYQFAIVKTQARSLMRKAADLQEDVMNKGLDANAVPKVFQPQNLEQDGMTSQLPGYGQQIVESQVETEDDQLRDRIRSLQTKEVLILRGDRDNSLVSRGNQDLNETLMKQHLSCMVLPHTEFQNRSKVQSSYLNRYLAVYVLFKTNENLFQIHDDVVKAFYI